MMIENIYNSDNICKLNRKKGTGEMIFCVTIFSNKRKRCLRLCIRSNKNRVYSMNVEWREGENFLSCMAM